MAKYYGAIGFGISTETSPGIFKNETVEHEYSGDILRNNRNLQSASQVNDNITISSEISILADPYASENFCNIQYATFMGVKWKVTSVSVQYPRLILTLGGVYN